MHVRFALESGQLANHLGKSALCQKQTVADDFSPGPLFQGFAVIPLRGKPRWSWQGAEFQSLAPTNKYLAKSNKSRAAGEATKYRDKDRKSCNARAPISQCRCAAPGNRDSACG